VAGTELFCDINLAGVIRPSFVRGMVSIRSHPWEVCCGVPLRCVTVRTKGVTMDSTFLMFAVVMLVIFIGGIIVYKKS